MQDLSIQSHDNLRLDGYALPAHGDARANVIVVHGTCLGALLLALALIGDAIYELVLLPGGSREVNP